jgi:hypothetical protein
VTHGRLSKTALSSGTTGLSKKNVWRWNGLVPRSRCAKSPRPLSSTTTGSDPERRISCGNRPPRVAFPSLPQLPAVPDLVDPDRWLQVSDGLHLVRQVRSDGSVRLDLKSYYVGRALAGQHVALHLSAAKRALLVVQGHQLIKTLPRKRTLWAGLAL